MDAPPPTGSHEPRRSRYEDLSDIQVPSASSSRARSGGPTVTTAGVILLVSGLQWILLVLLFPVHGGLVPVYLAMGVLAVAAAALVFLRHPAGRGLGLVVAGLGLVLGVVSAGSDALNALITLALNGFVIYALASNGPSFRRG